MGLRHGPRGAAVGTERVVVGTARRLAGVVLVDARGADDGEPPQHVARGGAERHHREAAHDAGLRARAPRVLALEAEHAVVLLGHALGDGVRELQEPVVELAEVAEDERLEFCFEQRNGL